MIKYFQIADNIGSGNFTDTFRQKTDKFQKILLEEKIYNSTKTFQGRFENIVNVKE